MRRFPHTLKLFLLLIAIYFFSFQKVYSQGSGTWVFLKGNQFWYQQSGFSGDTVIYPSLFYYLQSSLAYSYDCNYWKATNGYLWIHSGTYDFGGIKYYRRNLSRFFFSISVWGTLKYPYYPQPPYPLGTNLYPTSKYNVKGQFSINSTPSGRQGALTWTDTQGDMWLYGGKDTIGLHSDMWKYNIALNMW
ncbi:MAG: hypothetical protein RL708_839, partial [Bacteroidota bacterium]